MNKAKLLLKYIYDQVHPVLDKGSTSSNQNFQGKYNVYYCYSENLGV